MVVKSVSPSLRIQWETFSKTEQQKWNSEFFISTQYQTVSEDAKSIILSNSRFRMFRYLDGNNNYKIGYGYGNPEKRDGYTEIEAYSEWIKELKRKENILQRQIPLLSLTQSQFDAILSLYFLSGDWKKIKGTEGTYDVLSSVREGDWLTVANMLANATENREQRLREARIIVLGDYFTDKDRTWLRNEGIQYTRTQYVNSITDSFAKKQAEIAYYRQTNGTFLPNMREIRKREIVNNYENML